MAPTKAHWLRKPFFLAPNVNSIFDLHMNHRTSLFGAAFGAALLIACTLVSGCASDAPAFAAAGPFGGGTISQDVIDSQPRPPRQAVYRFDDHRYIESDPTGGYVGGCQGELYYVDEKLGIRTEFGGNKVKNPRGLFHVESPYVVVRDSFGLYVSFDQGGAFVFKPIDGQDDVLVMGGDIYVGGGGEGHRLRGAFSDNYVYWYTADPTEKTIETRHEPSAQPDRQVTARILALVRAEKPKFSNELDYFVCKDLPWRPSVKKEREMFKQQQKGKP